MKTPTVEICENPKSYTLRVDSVTIATFTKAPMQRKLIVQAATTAAKSRMIDEIEYNIYADSWDKFQLAGAKFPGTAADYVGIECLNGIKAGV